MKVIMKRMVLLLPLLLLLVFTSTQAAVVRIEDYEYYQDAAFVKTDSSEFSAAGITIDGRLFTWGLNLNGQLGTGDNVDKTTPTDVTQNFNLNENESIVDVSVGNKHMMVSTSENRVFGMGYNAYRQIGNNSTLNSNLPIDVTINFGFVLNENIVDIAAGEDASYLLTDTGRYFSWGYGMYGRLGNGSITNVTTVTDHTASLVLGAGESLVDIDVYDDHVLAISDTGNLYGWGYNGTGQLFLGDAVQRTTSTDLMSAFTFDVGETITHFSAGHLFNIVVTSAGKVYTAGTNQEGQVGDGTSMNRYDPTDITSQFGFGPSEFPIAIDTAYHTVLLTNEGRVFGWGRNSSGCIGPNAITYVVPTDITGNFSFDGELPVNVSVSAQNTYVLSDNARLYAWGSNHHGQIGNGYLGIAYNMDIPVKFDINFDILIQKDFMKNEVALFETKYSHSLLLLENGHLFAWGDNDDGAVGNGGTDDQLEPIDITDNLGLAVGETIEDFSTGRGHSVLLTSDHRVFTWGFNFYGQVGIDSQTDQLTPIDITSNVPLAVGDYIVSVYTGTENTFLISNDGNIFAFGRNLDGCLGDGTTSHQYLPIDVTANWGLEVGDNPSYILASFTWTFLVTEQNRIYSVGDNGSGQLADGTTVDKANPIQVTSNFPFDLSTIGIIDFQVGSYFAGLLNENNELYMWGSGSNGTTGSGGISFSLPTMINNQFGLNLGEVLTSISIGFGHNLVTTSDGRVFGYGFGTDYALITGYTINVSYPSDVTSNISIGADTIDYFALGSQTSFIVTNEKNLYAIGRNLDGQLGLGDNMIRQDLNKVTKDSHDLAGIKFIYMQEEQYVLNQYVYIELYFEHKIGDYLTGLTINGTTYDLTDIDEDAGKVTVRIPNTYTLGETPSFTIENVWFGVDSPVPGGPVDVNCTMYDDTEDPSFDPIAAQIIAVGSPDIDWTTYILNVMDNSPGIITLSEVDAVDYNTIALYSVTVTATDESGNFFTDSFDVNVIDIVPPVITYTGLVELEVGDLPYDFLAYATATDNLDGDITASMILTNPVDYDVVDSYMITFSVTDSSMNLTELQVPIDVTDTTGPTFDLPATEEIELGTSDIDWTTYMTNILDNSGEAVMIVEILDNVNYFVAGTYSVTVRATDIYMNITEDDILVTVSDTISPTSDPIDDITYEVNSMSGVDYSQYVTNIIEASLDAVSIDWVDVVDYGAVGMYPMSVVLTDSSMNTYTVYFDVYIEDTIAPVITYIGPATFEIGFTAPSYIDLVTLTDNSGIAVIVVSLLEDLDMNAFGTYFISYSVEDDAGNPASLIVYVDVVDTTVPTFDPMEDQVYYTGDPSPVEWSIYATNIVENSPEGVMFTYNDYVEYNNPGTYMVEIFAFDSSGNSSGYYFYVDVLDITPPDLEVSFVETSLYYAPNYYNDIYAYDLIDGDISGFIMIDDSGVNYDVAGTYIAYATISDSSGNEASGEITVYVYDLYAPTFDVIDDMLFELGEISNYDWLSLVTNLNDDSMEIPTVMLQQDDVDFTSPGQYLVVIAAEDGSSNSFQREFIVTIEDTVSPLLDPIDDIEIDYKAVEVSIYDVAHNATDASMQITYDLQCPSLIVGTLGNYICSITATDPSGNASAEYFIVSIVDDVPPLAELNGEDTIILELGEVYVELGATCLEANCTLILDASEIEDPDQECGDHVVRYIFTDENGNESMILRTVTIVDTTPPDIELNPGMDSIIAGGEHLDAGVTVDAPSVDVNVTTSPLLPGDYGYSTFTITYTAVDESMNETVLVRYVNVFDKAPEVEFEIGASFTTLQVGDTLETPLCVVRFDGNPEPCVFDTTGVDTSTPGTYTFSASASYHGTSYDREITVWVWDFADDQPAPVGYWKREEEVML